MFECFPANDLQHIALIGASLWVPWRVEETEEERTETGGRTIQIAFAVALALLGIIGIGSYLAVVRLVSDARGVAHTDEVITNLEEFLSRATDVETGERGYAITGEESYLEPYNSGIKEVNAIFSRLRLLTVDNALQQRRLENLNSVVAERLAIALAVINARKSEGFEGARRLVLSGKGTELHDRIREMAHEMIATERELLNEPQDRTKRTFTWLVIMSGYTVPTICVGFALFSIRRQLARRATLLATLKHQLSLLTQSKEQLQESEKRFRTLADSMPQLVSVAKADGFFYWYNQRWYEFTGTKPEQMEGWGWQSVHDPLVLPKVLVQWKASIATGQPFEMEFPLRRADGVYRSFLTRCLPLKDTKGQIVQWFGTNTDITELKRAEEKIRLVESKVREREGQLHLCVEHSPTAIVMLDREMKYLVVSHSWLEAYRLGEQSIIGRSHYEIMHDIPQRWIEILQRCMAGAVEKCDEDPFLRDDGRTDWVRWEVRPWRQADGAIGGIIIFSENITERKLAQEEILRLNADLESRVNERTRQLRAANVTLDHTNIELLKAAEAKDSFLANMSHELRTPLNGIIGFAEFLVDGKPGTVNPKQKEYLEDILNSGKHLLQLISDILDLAKVRSGKMEFYPEKFSLRKVIQETCAVSEPIAQKRGIHITMAVAPEAGDVTLDRQKFKQILFNLLSNAIKFNHDGGAVGISVELYDKDRFKLVVSDSGIGIEAENVRRLFNEFEQLESGASRRHEGTGLGLALTREIVELQGGKISVDSQFGKGSDFIVILPLAHYQGQPTVQVLDGDP